MNRARQIARTFRISETDIDLFVEPVDHLGRCVLGRADAEPGARLVAGHEFADCRYIRQLPPRVPP